jgi:hypothetical protein
MYGHCVSRLLIEVFVQPHRQKEVKINFEQKSVV